MIIMIIITNNKQQRESPLQTSTRYQLLPMVVDRMGEGKKRKWLLRTLLVVVVVKNILIFYFQALLRATTNET